ncbi:MAG: YfhO family protein [Candidatus Omnitrophica bacterium]|nr:YfhO family protein [Candidatus Omnitrophota bacterium]
MAGSDFLKIFLYVFGIAVFSVIPVYLFKKKLAETISVLLAVLFFFYFYRDFFSQVLSCQHDTKWTYEYLFLSLKQWLDSGIQIGWNPYFGAGQPLYLFSNYFLWTPWVIFCWVNRFININVYVLFHLFWMFLYINFSIGSFLLFRNLFNDFKVAFVLFLTLLFSQMFFVNLGQPTGITILYYLPYILFAGLNLLEKKSVIDGMFVLLFLSISVNHYMPHYIVFITLLCAMVAIVFNRSSLLSLAHRIFKRYKLLILTVSLSILIVSPLLLVVKEMNSVVSPNRGKDFFSQSPDASLELKPVEASVKGYSLLFNKPADNYFAMIHHGFYLGILPLLVLPLGLLFHRNRYQYVFLVLVVMMILFGTGNSFILWRLFRRFIFGFHFMRHSFGFAQAACFFILCLSGYGFLFLFSKVNSKLKWFLFSFIILITVFDLTGSNRRCLKYLKSGKMIANNQIVSPITRSFYYPAWSGVPPNLSPLVFKASSLIYRDDFIFFRNKRLDKMLSLFRISEDKPSVFGVDLGQIYFSEYEKVFAKGKAVDSNRDKVSIFYFTPYAQLLSSQISDQEYIKTIFKYFNHPFSVNHPLVFFQSGDIDFSLKNTLKNEPFPLFMVKKERSNPNRRELLVKSENESYLVWLENYHSGWRAFIDGKETKIFRANYAFSAVRVPPGNHHLVFSFFSKYNLLFYIHCFLVVLVVFMFWLYLGCGSFFKKQSILSNN